MRLLKLFTALLIVGILANCGVRRNTNRSENFHRFHKKFYRDSVFHFSRINYPLKVNEHSGYTRDYPKGDNRNRNTLSTFSKNTLPRTVISIKKYPKSYVMDLDTVKNKIVEKIYLPHSSYIEKRFFILKKQRWYLDSIRIVN